MSQFEGLPAHLKLLTLLLLSGTAQGATEICLAPQPIGTGDRETRVYFKLRPGRDGVEAPPEWLSGEIVEETRVDGVVVREFPPLPIGEGPLVLGEIRRLAGVDSWRPNTTRTITRGSGDGAFRVRVDEQERDIFVSMDRSSGWGICVLTIGWNRHDPTA